MSDGLISTRTDLNILVVDDDEGVRNIVASYLKNLGQANVQVVEDGEACWDKLAAEQVDFVVLDWQLPKLSGMAILNRMRKDPRMRMTPVVVVSGLIDKSDFRLLEEFPVTKLLEKPFTRTLFNNLFNELRAEYDWYIKHQALMESLFSALQNQEGDTAKKLIAQVAKQAPNPIPVILLSAKMMLDAGFVKQAIDVLDALLRNDAKSLRALNLLGQAYHKLGRHKNALEVLSKAQGISPSNVERLCLLGELELNLRDPDAARKHFTKALSVDHDDQVARSGLVVAENMISLLDGNDLGKVPQGFASLMNTLGITLVRNGEFDKGIAQYKAAMSFLHSDRDAGRVAFNLGLGYLRWGKPTDALSWFKKSESLSPEIREKSGSYIALYNPERLPGSESDSLLSPKVQELPIDTKNDKSSAADDLIHMLSNTSKDHNDEDSGLDSYFDTVNL